MSLKQYAKVMLERTDMVIMSTEQTTYTQDTDIHTDLMQI